MDWSTYAGREQTGVKHFVLRQYLQRLAYKIGYYGGTLNYVDGFAGPWKQATDDLSDTSPFIAIHELRWARDGLVAAGRPRLRVRCLFIEKDPHAYAELERATSDIEGVEVTTLQGEFEEHIDEVRRFGQVGSKAFAFNFIDPTGWTGFGLQAITPLLQQDRCEVLINFMMKDIKRFIDDEASSARSTFIDLFGSLDRLGHWRELEGSDREDAIVGTYCEQVKAAGRFTHVGNAVVLHPEHDRTHFHLVHATRSLTGLQVFREVEGKAMEAQEQAHDQARQRARVEKRGQTELFAASVLGSSYQGELRVRYQGKARGEVKAALTEAEGKPILYDLLMGLALSFPMTGERELKGWLKEWRAAGLVSYLGLPQGGRVPKSRKGHLVCWKQ